VPNPEPAEPPASENPEISASEPETSGPEAAAGPGPEGAAEPVAKATAEPKSAAKASEKTTAEAQSGPAPDTTAKLKSEPASGKSKKPRRFRPLRRLVAIISTLLVISGATVTVIWRLHLFGSGPDPDLKQVTPTYRPWAQSLPWPADGETALWAQGIGSLGTCGDQRPVPIASVAKIMTAYVILQDHPLPDSRPGPEITVDQAAETESYSRDESSAPVRAGQRLSERSLLELMLVPSANNVARLLARWDAGTQDAFVTKMNAAAAELGMKNTVYTDPSGFDSTTQSTAEDQLRLAESALTDPTLLALTAEPSTQVPDDPAILTNTDSLLGSYGVVGGKTGSSTPAGGALMWAAHRPLKGEDHLVLGVVLDQASGTTPEHGLNAVLVASQLLVEAMH
jgi:D-alanyl-D-alanine carboxypeptidase (penicillin-binding protein 5/6)